MNIALIALLTFVSLPTNFALAADAGGCEETDFVTLDAPAVTVAFQGMGYTPRCLRVKAGTAVTLPANGAHPLQGLHVEGSPTNPFVMPQPATSAQTRTLAEPGRFPYFCVRHRTMGMTGTILVE